MYLVWPWTILMWGQILTFEWETVKESIVVYDMKVGICSQVHEYMDHNVCQRTISFSDLGTRSVRLNITPIS